MGSSDLKTPHLPAPADKNGAPAANERLEKAREIVIPSEARNLLFVATHEKSRFLASLGMTKREYFRAGGRPDHRSVPLIYA